MSNIYIASDHAGFALKSELISYLTEAGHTVGDEGAYMFDAEDDFPDYVIPAVKKCVEDENSFAIVIGASGQGEAIAASIVKGARAAVYYGDTGAMQLDNNGNKLSILESARAHNNANVLALGARFISVDEAKKAVTTFLETPFSDDERHVRRLAKLS
jgi:ribose 5-phosphate isomerase B